MHSRGFDKVSSTHAPCTRAACVAQRFPCSANGVHSLTCHFLTCPLHLQLLFSLGRSFPDFLRWVAGEGAATACYVMATCDHRCLTLLDTCRSLNNLFLHVSVDMPGFAAFECHVEQVE